MSDVFTRYELALEQLLTRLGPAHPRAAEARTLQARLLENIAAARLHGDTETRRAERSEIRAALDLLATEALKITFNELAFSPDRDAEAGEAPAAMAGRVFLAYSHHDQDFALRLAANLRDRGVPLWVDRWDIRPGEDWDQAIDDAAYDCGRFLVVLSPAAVESPDVRGELRIALAERKPIVPVLYRNCRIPRQLQLVQYVDFAACGPDDPAALRAVLGALGVRPAPAPREGGVRPATLEEPGLPRQPFEPEMVFVPAGPFIMGDDKSGQSDEKPAHEVYLEDYYIARTPVTNAQYAAFVQATGYRAPGHWKKGSPPPQLADHPVVFVTWHDALAYCRWLAEATGRPYALPTEAQWEKAARGTDGRIYPWGNKFDKSKCNTVESGTFGTTPVGKYSPQGDSPYGVADMTGNVWEWCSSLYQPYPYRADDGREEAAAGGSRVLRGGSWNSSRDGGRCAFRFYDLDPVSDYDRYGFRCCLAAGPFSP